MSSRFCRVCKEEKPLVNFVKDKNCKDGYRHTCKSCSNTSARSRSVKYKTRISNYNKTYYKNNSEVIKQQSSEYYRNNKEKILPRVKIYKSLNQDRIKSLNSERRATKRQATPSWLSKRHKKEIQDLFWLAQDLRSVTGEEYHVDHIVPLTNEIVCGLHVPWNLQILPSDINLSKSNSFDDQEEGLNYAH